MVENVFPLEFSKLILKYIDEKNLFEIRIRINQAIIFNISNSIFFLSSNGLTKNITMGIVASPELVSKIFYIICENSVYSVNNQIREGFITIKNGIRIGIAGEVVYGNKIVNTIKNISYMNIRFPHKIDNCSERIFDYIIDKSVKNTLILSSPGMGKTTFLRDIVYQIYKNKIALNCLILDERYEIAGLCDGKPQFNLGSFTDVLSGCKKQYGFECGIRSMNPDIIFTDELATINDVYAVEYAINCGISVIATTHSKNITELIGKPSFAKLIDNKLFKRYIVLNKLKGVGTIEGVYDENLKLLYRD